MSDETLCSSAEPRARRAELAAWIENLLADIKARRAPPLWYLWGGSTSLGAGLDCSGLVVFWARKLGLDVPRWNTDRMWNELQHVEVPEPGDLALYGKGEKFDPASHVMIVLGPAGKVVDPAGRKPSVHLFRVAGMSGGGSKTTSRAVAEQQGAQLKEYPSHLYRRDFIGFVRLPFGGAAEEKA